MKETKKIMTKEQRKVLIYVVRKRNQQRFYTILPKSNRNKEWIFTLYHDHGERTPDAKCESCGSQLRNEFIIRNKITKERMTLGSNCLVKKLDIPHHLADEVFERVEYFYDDERELLDKYNSGFELNMYLKKHLKMIKVPKQIKLLLDADLPLLDSQINYLYEKITKVLEDKKREERAKKMFIGPWEIKSETVYKVATGEINANEFFEENYSEVIYDLLKKSRGIFIIDYDIINHLVKNGLPNEIAYGQHALINPLRNYLMKERSIQAGEDNLYGDLHFRIV